MLIEKLSAYKKALKGFLRAVVKAGVFADENKTLSVHIQKNEEDDEKTVSVVVAAGQFKAEFSSPVVTRIYNKFNGDLLADCLKIFKNSKKISGTQVIEG